MKRLTVFLIYLVAMTPVFAQKLYLTIDGVTVSATMQNNVATQALVELLQQGNITYNAHDYGGFEKVGALGHTLSSSDKQTTTQAGDIVLYSSNQVVIFYGSNSWAYTRLATIDGATAESVSSFVKAGQGEVAVTLSLTSPNATSTDELTPSRNNTQTRYNLLGQIVDGNYHGITIQKGKKTLR